jgi:predicted RecB family endonuclease
LNDRRLSDIDGPRSGADKRCHLRVVPAGLPDVVVEDTEADLYVAVDRAVDLAGHTLVRKIDRQQTLLKQGRSYRTRSSRSTLLANLAEVGSVPTKVRKAT